jgi:catechol 2,3-dioxygenase-like lactoylglutathione lyase family enzyme
MDMKLELVLIPVTDVDRAKAFYERAGFNIDVDHRAGDAFRVVQVTPPGSACSFSFGVGLAANGVDVSEPFHFGEQGQAPGLHPERADYGTYASFSDPDGNSWLLQERKGAAVR